MTDDETKKTTNKTADDLVNMSIDDESASEIDESKVVENGEDEEDDVVFDDEAELGPAEIIKKLRAKLKAAVDEKQKYLDNWQRDKAEFMNARRRDEESKAEFLKFSKQGVIEEVLPVLDSFDMAMTNSGGAEWQKLSPEWQKGISGIYNQLSGILGNHGATSFGAPGDAFDPNLHHSIGMVKTEDAAQDHKVAEVMQKGYMLSGKVVRPALVKVWEV